MDNERGDTLFFSAGRSLPEVVHVCLGVGVCDGRGEEGAGDDGAAYVEERGKGREEERPSWSRTLRRRL